jgi:hypothetical protein
MLLRITEENLSDLFSTFFHSFPPSQLRDGRRLKTERSKLFHEDFGSHDFQKTHQSLITSEKGAADTHISAACFVPPFAQ